MAKSNRTIFFSLHSLQKFLVVTKPNLSLIYIIKSKVYTLILLFFVSSNINFTFFIKFSSCGVLKLMTDFPPNPEDGELWIPSDIFLEIVSNNIRPQKDYSHSPSNNHNFTPNKNASAPNVDHHQPKKSIPKRLPKTKSRPKSQVFIYFFLKISFLNFFFL